MVAAVDNYVGAVSELETAGTRNLAAPSRMGSGAQLIGIGGQSGAESGRLTYKLRHKRLTKQEPLYPAGPKVLAVARAVAVGVELFRNGG